MLSTCAILEFALFVSIVSIYSSSPLSSLTSRFRFSISLFRATMIHRCASKHAGAVANCSNILYTFLPGRFCSAYPTIFSQCRIGPSVWIYSSHLTPAPTSRLSVRRELSSTQMSSSSKRENTQRTTASFMLPRTISSNDSCDRPIARYTDCGFSPSSRLQDR